MFADGCAPFAPNRIPVIQQGDKVLSGITEGHRYEIKLHNRKPFTGVLCMHWTDGHVTAQFLLDDGDDDYLELQAWHYIEYLKDQGEAEVLERIKKAVMISCSNFAIPFSKSLIRIECSLHYCGNAVYDKAWESLVEEGNLSEYGIHPMFPQRMLYMIA